MSILEGFAGPGGLSEAAKMIGLPGGMGVEVNADACATATAAGHTRIKASIRDLNPDDIVGVEGWVSGPPCPTYSESGKRSGRCDYDLVLAGSTALGDSMDAVVGSPEDNAYAGTYAAVADERSALVLETLRFALRLPDLQWLVAEQVPAVKRIWQDFSAELSYAGWESCVVVSLRADDFGAATRRTRVFLIAGREFTPDLSGMPIRGGWRTGRFGAPHDLAPVMVTPFPETSMAQVFGWPPWQRINTRGDRKTSGGNEFSADAPAPSLTGKARSWYRVGHDSIAGQLDARHVGRMQGFPLDYPWQGSRSSRFQQIADSVSPLMGAAVLGAASGRPWRDAAWARLAAVYGVEPSGRDRLCTTGRGRRDGQLGLFGEAA